jgi:hypothetical protein
MPSGSRPTINRIADILARHGDTDLVAVRRSKDIGILAQPAEAAAWIWITPSAT